MVTLVLGGGGSKGGGLLLWLSAVLIHPCPPPPLPLRLAIHVKTGHPVKCATPSANFQTEGAAKCTRLQRRWGADNTMDHLEPHPLGIGSGCGRTDKDTNIPYSTCAAHAACAAAAETVSRLRHPRTSKESVGRTATAVNCPLTAVDHCMRPAVDRRPPRARAAPTFRKPPKNLRAEILTAMGLAPSRLATGVHQLRHNHRAPDPTELCVGCSLFLLSSGGARGTYY